MVTIGLMSGTSLDAADAVLADFSGDRPAIIATASLPPPQALRDELLQLPQQHQTITLRRLGMLHQQLGTWFADAANAVLDAAKFSADRVAAIGSHGQTVRHEPDLDPPFSIQLGSASRIAALTGCTVVADFRSADLAIGGQGAPLVPAFHRALFARPDAGRIIVNIGGIANLTVLPAGSDRVETGISGFDTGPGNGLMDNWIHARLGSTMDRNGHWAASGAVHERLLRNMLRDPYLQRPPPKSTGREYFNLPWLQHQLDVLNEAPAAADVQATLCEFSARTIASAISTCGTGYDEVIICGGGSHNPRLMQRLTTLLQPRKVTTTTEHGIDADWVEASAFAWLAMRRLRGLPGNLPSVTGARAPAILGAIHAPPAGADSYGE